MKIGLEKDQIPGQMSDQLPGGLYKGFFYNVTEYHNKARDDLFL
jgi:hypothetical protein